MNTEMIVALKSLMESFQQENYSNQQKEILLIGFEQYVGQLDIVCAGFISESSGDVTEEDFLLLSELGKMFKVLSYNANQDASTQLDVRFSQAVAYAENTVSTLIQYSRGVLYGEPLFLANTNNIEKASVAFNSAFESAAKARKEGKSLEFVEV